MHDLRFVEANPPRKSRTKAEEDEDEDDNTCAPQRRYVPFFNMLSVDEAAQELNLQDRRFLENIGVTFVGDALYEQQYECTVTDPVCLK